MAKLIVRDGERAKAYRIRKGRLTIGSGDEVKLRLQSEGVAATHAVLEVADGRARLVPHPGAPCPIVDGEEMGDAFELDYGQRVELGGAVLEWSAEAGDEAVQEDAEDEAPDAPAVPRAPKSVVRARKSSLPSYRGQHRSKSKGPTVLISIGIAAALAVAFFTFFERSTGQAGMSDAEALRVAEQMLDARDLAGVDRVLAGMTPSGVSDELRPRLVAALDRADALREQSDQDAANVEGFKYFNSKLEGYWDKHLADGESPERGYFLLLRMREFEEQWPTHPELAWVREKRAALGTSLAVAPTYEELLWAVDYITGSKPRRFDWADELVKKFAAECGDCDEADRVRKDVNWDRSDYFATRRDEAVTALKQGNASKAVGYLVGLVRWIHDDELADRAAQSLLKIPEVESYLATMKTSEPEMFGDLTAQSRIAAFADERGL